MNQQDPILITKRALRQLSHIQMIPTKKVTVLIVPMNRSLTTVTNPLTNQVTKKSINPSMNRQYIQHLLILTEATILMEVVLTAMEVDLVEDLIVDSEVPM